jgi:hypothetical protein
MHKITQNSLLKKHGIFCLTFSSRFALTFFPILHILNAIHSDEGKEYPRGRCREGPDGARPSGGAGKVVPELRA